MSVLRARMITTNNYFCRDVYIFKGYICSSTMHEFHMLSKLSIYIIDHLIQKVIYCTYMCTINHYARYRLYMRGKVLCLNTKTKNHL